MFKDMSASSKSKTVQACCSLVFFCLPYDERHEVEVHGLFLGQKNRDRKSVV